MLFGSAYFGLVIAFVIAILLSFASYYYSDSIVLGISSAREVKHSEFPFLDNAVEGLAIASGLPKPRLYIINDTAPNAFATGRNPQKSVICVTSGLLQKLNRNELEAVLGHEMSHIKNYDTRLMVITVVLVGVIVLMSDWIIRSLWYGRSGSRNMGKAEWIILAIGIVFAILSPFIAQIIKMAISRRREFLADADSALLTKNPPALASALEKISNDKDKATAHLYIINPLKNYKGWLDNLFSTHPPIKERIAALREM
ncbi:MAG: M48 family metallopeptidase [Candidatus Diapherotrites archaeon]|nr:M48 family metallopeptidase [Candidatus Diapherotrites archaeon]